MKTFEDLVAEVYHLLMVECRDKNWDGYNAEPLDPFCAGSGVGFLHRMLTREDLPMPSVGADPDGDLNFDWYDEKTKNNLSVSFSKDGIAWAQNNDGYGALEYDENGMAVLIPKIRKYAT